MANNGLKVHFTMPTTSRMFRTILLVATHVLIFLRLATAFQVGIIWPKSNVNGDLDTKIRCRYANWHHGLPVLSFFKLSMGDIDEEISTTTKSEVRNIANHLSKQTLQTLLTPSDAVAISNELLFDSQSTIFNDNSYQQYIKYWTKLEERLRKETNRTPADFLGEEITERVLSSIRREGSNFYDPQTVRTFLESDAVNSLFSQLLYDAIFEFTVKFDILGNAVSNLPLLGPMRNQILAESKRNVDRTLGPLLQQFLSRYIQVATRQAVDFVVSKENASSFGKANARLVDYLLRKRTVAEWIPDEATLAKWREDVWAYLVGLEEGDGDRSTMLKEDQRKLVEQYISWVYELVGDKCVKDTGFNVDEILDASPTLERNLGSFWDRCRDAAKSN